MAAEQITTTAGNEERKIMAIIHRLPPERKAQMLAFARFLAFETYQTTDLDFLEDEVEFDDTHTESDVRWDELLTSDEGQLVLDKLADEALAEIRAGNAKSIDALSRKLR